MKLWMRVYLLALPLALAILILCSGRLLMLTHEDMMNREYERALSDHSMVCAALTTHMDAVAERFAHDASLQRAALAAAARNYAAYYTGEDVALAIADGGELLYDGMLPDERQAMGLEPETYQRQHVLRRLGGRELLFVSGWIELSGSRHRVDYLRDISAATQGIRSFARQVAVMMLLASLVLCAGLYAVISAAMRPFGALTKQARAMAGGDYEGRIPPMKGELGELAGAYNDMASAVQARVSLLEEANRDREAFIANLAHEMKSPMTTILGYSDLLSRAKMTDEQRERALSGIRSEGQRLDALSKKLLGLFGLRGEGALELRTVDTRQLLDAVAEAQSLQLRQAGLSLDIRCEPAHLALDPELMKVALINLLDNAVKASSPGGQIELIHERGALRVRDHGRGIPEDELDRIRQPFYMVDKQRARSQNGAGLGLTLCEAIAAAHGARLEIESEPGKGATVSIVF